MAEVAEDVDGIGGAAGTRGAGAVLEDEGTTGGVMADARDDMEDGAERGWSAPCGEGGGCAVAAAVAVVVVAAGVCTSSSLSTGGAGAGLAWPAVVLLPFADDVPLRAARSPCLR